MIRDAPRSVLKKLCLFKVVFTCIDGIEYSIDIRITSRIDDIFWHITLFIDGAFLCFVCFKEAGDNVSVGFEIKLYVFGQFEATLLFHSPLGLLHHRHSRRRRLF